MYGKSLFNCFFRLRRLQDNHEALREIFLRLLSLITLVTFPLFIAIAAGSEFIIVTVYGAAWLGAAQFLALLHWSCLFY